MLAGHPRGRPLSSAEAARYTLAPTRTHLAYHHATDPAQRRRALRLDKDRIDAPNYIDLGRMGRGQSEHRISLLVRDGHPQHLAYYRIYLAWQRQALRLDQTQRLDKDLLDSEKNEWVQPAALALHSGHAALHQVQLPRRAAQPIGHALQTHGRQVQQRLLRGDAWWPAPWPDLSWTLEGDQTASAQHAQTLAAAALPPDVSHHHNRHGGTPVAVQAQAHSTAHALHAGDVPTPQASLVWLQITEPWPPTPWLRAIDSRATTTT